MGIEATRGPKLRASGRANATHPSPSRTSQRRNCPQNTLCTECRCANMRDYGRFRAICAMASMIVNRTVGARHACGMVMPYPGGKTAGLRRRQTTSPRKLEIQRPISIQIANYANEAYDCQRWTTGGSMRVGHELDRKWAAFNARPC